MEDEGGVSELVELDIKQAIAAAETEIFLDGKVELRKGDCLEILSAMPENSVGSIVCDPPYHLHSIVKRFAKTGRTESTKSKSGPHQRTATGFMGRTWDGGDIAFQVSTWQACFRVLKPGGYILAFSSSRTFGRMSVAIEDAGFITHPMCGWMFGQGFPKAHKVGHPDWDGWAYGAQTLKPAFEPIYMGQKPFSEKNGLLNILKWGVGALNIDGCRVPCDEPAVDRYDEESQDIRYTDAGSTNFAAKPGKRRGRPLRVVDPKESANGAVYAGRRETGHGFDGVSKAAGFTDVGRHPSHLFHDGSECVTALFQDSNGQQGDVAGTEPSRTGAYGTNCYGEFGRIPAQKRNDDGSAARFFWSSKAAQDDRLGSRHPTVKPIDLMQELIRLTTPKGETVLDPFAGTGTTGEAAWREGMRAILIEREPEYQADIARRMELAANPTKRAAVAKTKNNLDDPNDLPLFSGGNKDER